MSLLEVSKSTTLGDASKSNGIARSTRDRHVLLATKCTVNLLQLCPGTDVKVAIAERRDAVHR
jgi:hypothetical protein